MTAQELRIKYLKFFESKKHKVVPSDSLIPANDPTLLFTSAGMNQFKDQFMGKHITYRRATSCQKCLRTGDLDNVGRTAGHHTFFEMLGNFSFGDYFKKEAIRWAWEFVADVLGLDEERLWVSVYKDDNEAYDLWRDDIKVPSERIKRYGAHDNFWPADAPLLGPNGPCGPCSEIFYDQGKDVGCKKEGCEPSCDCDRFVEVWNLVFTQFERVGKNKLLPLKNKNIDTGMGLERLAAVMQGVRNNFQTDLFVPIIDGIKVLANGRRLENDFRLNAVADHIRAVCFMVADGILPSNEERGYVERMLIRRAYRFGKELGFTSPFLYKLVPAVAKVMKVQYPEIETMRESIADVILNEEQRFQNTLEEGTKVLEEVISGLKKRQKRILSGRDAFKLYDTYGFPIELTDEIARREGISIDRETFEKAMERQRDMARLRSKIKGAIFDESAEESVLRKTAESLKSTVFLGYKTFDSEATVQAIISGGRKVAVAKTGTAVEVILDKTPFYGEAGGQVGDTGMLFTKTAKVAIHDTKRVGDVIVHQGKVQKGRIRQKNKVRAVVDGDSRLDIARNHTATHLLHYALREVLGRHVKQSGSLVAKDRLRFDFMHFKAVDKRQLDRIEDVVNELVRRNLKVKTEKTTLDLAKKKGAIALFGEKYGRKVRMVSIGDCSKELCGGTHLDYTGQIGLFKVVSESSIASGIRRIEACTGRMALKYVKDEEDLIYDAAAVLRTNKKDFLKVIEETSSRVKQLEKEIAKIRQSRAAVNTEELIKNSFDIGGAKVIFSRMDNMDMRTLRTTADAIKRKVSSSIVVLGSEAGGKVVLVCSVSQDLVKKGASADNIIKKISGVVGGSGGGRPDFAQAGGKDTSKLDEALKSVVRIVEGELKK